MTREDLPPPLPRTHGRERAPPLRMPGAGGNVRRVGVAVYSVLAIVLAGVAFYMGAVVGHPLTSPYVVAPAIGAAWFGLRLFMTLAPRG